MHDYEADQLDKAVGGEFAASRNTIGWLEQAIVGVPGVFMVLALETVLSNTTNWIATAAVFGLVGLAALGTACRKKRAERLRSWHGAGEPDV